MYDDRRDGDDEGEVRDDRHARRSPRRHRSRSRSRTREAGKPTDTVILEGLPFGVSTAELRDGLLTSSIAGDFPSISVRISSSRSQTRAFVQFESLNQAAAFVKEHFPRVLIQLHQSTDDAPDGRFEAYIHYARNRDETEPRGLPAPNWTCPKCEFSNYSTRSVCKVCGTAQPVVSWEQSFTGAADVAEEADAMSQILVVFPLPSFITEDMFVKDIRSLEKPEEPKASAGGPSKLKSTAPTMDSSRFGARPGSLHRVFLMRDASSQESFKYGFVEFWTLEDAAGAMEKFRSVRSFTVAGCAVTIAPTHMGVFLPEEREVTPDIEHMSFHPLFNPALRVRYRNLHIFPSQVVVAPDPPGDASSGAGVAAIDAEAEKAKRAKKRKAEASIGAAAKKQVPMAGQMAVWQRKHDELHQDSAPESGPKADGKAPIKISISNATQLGTRSEAPASPPKAVVKEPTVGNTPSEGLPADDAGTSFVDRDRLMCLICMRKYKSIDEVNIHERSKNHKTATEDPDKVKAAMPRLAAVRAKRQKDADAESQAQYRDRAKERRDIYNQPKQPSNKPSKGSGDNNPKKQVKPEEDKPSASKGAGMLAKMGWTAGSGLGANKDGRTEAIATTAYQDGVGLGAEGGNLGDAAELAEKKTTNSYAQYVSSVQDKARQRYNQMN